MISKVNSAPSYSEIGRGPLRSVHISRDLLRSVEIARDLPRSISAVVHASLYMRIAIHKPACEGHKIAFAQLFCHAGVGHDVACAWACTTALVALIHNLSCAFCIPHARTYTYAHAHVCVARVSRAHRTTCTPCPRASCTRTRALVPRTLVHSRALVPSRTPALARALVPSRTPALAHSCIRTCALVHSPSCTPALAHARTRAARLYCTVRTRMRTSHAHRVSSLTRRPRAPAHRSHATEGVSLVLRSPRVTPFV